ncbi:hypothetical protein DFP72DRAFT_746231, partial [Ephemerocybe angulata]
RVFETTLDILDVHLQLRPGEGKESELVHVYKQDLGHDETVEHFSNPLKQIAPLLRIIFVRGHVFLAGSGQQEAPPHGTADFNDVHPAMHPATAEFLSSRLGVSPAFLSVLLKKTWVVKTGNCCWTRRVNDATGNYNAIEGWYRYSCGLKNYPSHVWFSYTPTSTTYIMNNCKYNGVQDSIIRCIEGGMTSKLLRPLAIDGLVMEAASEAWGKSILKPRMTLVEYEHLDESKIEMDPSESIRELHILSYHLLVIKEDMVDHIERLGYLIEVHNTLSTEFETLSPKPLDATSTPDLPPTTTTSPTSVATGICVSHVFKFLLSETQIRKRWVQTYADRTGIQMNLFYALSSQRDNWINLKIAGLTSKIATETQKDSSSMITMATVTMLFLPGTFVSAVFSMGFFNASSTSAPPALGQPGLSIAPSWWLYPAITVPLTILVFASWH